MIAPRRVLLMVGVLLMAANSGAAALEIVGDGRSRTMIVVPGSYLPVQMLAAQELQHHVERATGVELLIVPEPRRPQRTGLIYVGPCDQAAAVGLATNDLPPAGFRLRTIEGDLFLLGDGTGTRIGSNWESTRHGTLFAVYEFLERELGVRWLWPGRLGEFIPERTELTVGELDLAGEPRFLDSLLNVPKPNTESPDGWASEDSRARFLVDQDRWLLRHRFSTTLSHRYGHAFAEWWNRLGAEHPEHFNLLRLERIPEDIPVRAQSYGVAINLMLDMYELDGDAQWLAAAERYGRWAIETLYWNGLFREAPDLWYQDSHLGTATLVYALVRLHVAANDLSVDVPPNVYGF